MNPMKSAWMIRLRCTRRQHALCVSALMVLTGALAACNDDDVGTCCSAIDGVENVEIPQPIVSEDGVQSAIRRDPNFACDFLTCVAYRGSEAYCTRDCVDDNDCPDGFECLPVLQSDPGPGSQIQIDDKFCVRDNHQCTE